MNKDSCNKDCDINEWYFTKDNGQREWVQACPEHTPEKVHPIPKSIKNFPRMPKD